MRPFSGIPGVPADICRQIQSLPLSDDDRRDVASAMASLLACRLTMPGGVPAANGNAPQPDWQRGV